MQRSKNTIEELAEAMEALAPEQTIRESEKEALKRTLAGFEEQFKSAKGQSKADLKKAIERIKYDLGMKGGVAHTTKKDLGGRSIGLR